MLDADWSLAAGAALAPLAAAALLLAAVASLSAAAALLSICEGGVPAFADGALADEAAAPVLPTLFAFVWLLTGGVCCDAADCVSTELAALAGSPAFAVEGFAAVD